MINILKNYRKLFLLALKSELVENSGEGIQKIDKNSFKGDSLSDLKALKKVVGDGMIDEIEAKIIVEKANEITGEAKNSLKKMSVSMLDKGFSVENIQGYESFQKLLLKSGFIIPDYQLLMTNINSLKNSRSKKLLSIDVIGNSGVVYFEDSNGKNYKLDFKFDGKSISKMSDFIEYNLEVPYGNNGWVDERILSDNGNFEAPKQEEPKQEEKQHEEPKKEESKNEAPKQEAQKSESKQEKPKQEVQKTETKQPEAKKQETPIKESKKPESSKSEPKKQDKQKPDKQKPEESKQDKQKKSPQEFFDNYSLQERKEIQRILKVPDDGKFGPKTQNAILKFQKENKLVVDGKVGPITLGKLKELNSNSKVKNNEDLTDDMFNNPQNYEDYNKENLIKVKENNEKKSNQVSFIGENGEEVFVEYDQKKMGLHINTAFGDGVDDFILNNGEFRYKEEALLYLEKHIDEVKAEYDRRVNRIK